MENISVSNKIYRYKVASHQSFLNLYLRACKLGVWKGYHLQWKVYERGNVSGSRDKVARYKTSAGAHVEILSSVSTTFPVRPAVLTPAEERLRSVAYRVSVLWNAVTFNNIMPWQVTQVNEYCNLRLRLVFECLRWFFFKITSASTFKTSETNSKRTQQAHLASILIVFLSSSS